MHGRGMAANGGGQKGGRHVPAYSGSIGQKAQLASAYAELGKELLSTQLRVVGNYTLGRVIGEGSFGKVRLGVHRLTGTRVAIKHIPKSSSPPLLTREIHHHRRLHHPCVVQMYEIIATEHSIWLVTELCAGGELFDYLVEKGRLTEHEARKIFGQLCLGMGYVHREGVVHRDLKLENVLLDQRCNAKVADFGFGREFEPRKMMETYCGTTGYAAPEMLAGRKYCGEEVDIWSMGIILYTLLAGSLPFDDDDEEVMKEQIIKGEYLLPDFLSREARDLISLILQTNPKSRPSIEAILSHAWFTVPAVHHDFGSAFSSSPALRHATIAEEEPPSPASAAGASSTLDEPARKDEPVPRPESPHSTSSASSHGAGRRATATGLGILSESEVSERSSTGASDFSLHGGSSSRSGASSPVTSEDPAVSIPEEDSVTPTAVDSTDSAPTPVGPDAKLGLQHPNVSESTIRKSYETSSVVAKGKRRQAPPALPTHEEGEALPHEEPPPSTPGFQFPLMPPAKDLPTPSARAGSLKRRSVPSSPAFFTSPNVGNSRTPSRTKRRSIGSTISERMLPLDDISVTVAPFDYVGTLRNTPHGPPLSTREDEALLATLGALGFDAGQMSHSIKTNACDASGAIWWLLKRKAEAKDETRLAPGQTPLQTFSHPHKKNDRPAAREVIEPAKAEADDERDGQATPAIELQVPSPSEGDGPGATTVTEPPPPSRSTESTATPPSSSGYFTALGAESDLADAPAREGATATPPSVAGPKGGDGTPTIPGTPGTPGTPKSAERKRSQSVSMLQRATSALASKKSDEGKQLGGKGKQKEIVGEGEEVAGKKEAGPKVLIPKNLDEVNRSGSNLPLAALFSRRTVSDTRGADRSATPTKAHRGEPASPERRPSVSLPASPLKPDAPSPHWPIPSSDPRTPDRRPTMSSSGTYETLSTVAGDDEGGPHRAKTNRARVNLFSTFRLWFNEDRRKRKRKLSGSGGAYAGAMNRSASGQSVRSRTAATASGYRLAEPVVLPPKSSPIVRQVSSGSRRSSIHSSRRVSLDLALPVRSRRRSDSSRASFGSLTGSRTPTSDHGSTRSARARGSLDTRRGHGHMRQASTGSAHSRRSAHLSPTQPYRRTPSGTTVRRITTSTHGTPRPNLHPRTHSQASSGRMSASSDDEAVDQPEIIYGNGHDVEETIVEEAEGGEDDDRNSASERARALRKLSGELLRGGVGEADATSVSGRKASEVQTFTVFTAHKNHNVFGTPTAAAASKSSSWGRALNGSRTKLRDVFARSSEDGDWVDEDDDPLFGGRYSGGLGQSTSRGDSSKPRASIDKAQGGDGTGATPHTPPVASSSRANAATEGSLLGEGRYAGLGGARSEGGGGRQRARGPAFKGSAIVEEEEADETEE